MNGASHELLARARLAGHENGARRCRHRLEDAEEFTKYPALADDPLEAVTLLQLGPEIRILAPEPSLLERTVEDVEQFLGLEGLRDRSPRRPV